MATVQMNMVMQHLRRAVLLQDGTGRTDRELLASFIEQKDEAAFEALVRRHGPMVFGVCRRVVGNHHDAEDAFQATFLVLSRKASSVRPRERLANWLHGVALRTAMKSKAMTAKRRVREKQVVAMPEPEAAQQDQWRDVQPLLDQELTGLPENYRLPILLCDLEGKTIKDAARQLGWPQGSVAGRLARGRKLLAKRLANRGVVLSAGLLAVVVSRNAASAAVPTSLMTFTVKAAAMIAAGPVMVAGLVPAKVAALMEGVTKAMLLSKLKTATAGLLLVALICGGAGAIYQTQAAEQPKAQKANKEQLPAADKKDEKPKPDKERLQGTWKSISCVDDGQKNRYGVGDEWTFKDRTIKVILHGKVDDTLYFRFRLDEATNPKVIDLVHGKADDLFDTAKLDKRLDNPDERKEGIYSIAGETLRICLSGKKGERPTAFESKQGSDYILIVLRREKDTLQRQSVPKKDADEKNSDNRTGGSSKDIRGSKAAERTQPKVDLVWDRLGIKLEVVDPSSLADINAQLRGGMRITSLRRCITTPDGEVQESPAAEAKLKVGDILVGLHTWQTLSPEEVLFTLGYCQGAGTQSLRCYVVRDGQVISSSFALPKKTGEQGDPPAK